MEVSKPSVDADEKQIVIDATVVAAEPKTEEKASEEPQLPDVSVMSKADSELPTDDTESEQPSNAEALDGEDSQQVDMSAASTDNPPTDATETDGSAGEPPSTKTVDVETS